MTFSKKYKYRSITKKKLTKFFFFFRFFSFFFQSEFFFLVFQKKSNVFDFNFERKVFAKKGFIFKKTSSTFLRHFLRKYKPFFKGFNSFSFDFHFFCIPKQKNIEFASSFLNILKTKEMEKKYQVLLFSYKGRFYTKSILDSQLFPLIETNKKQFFFNKFKIFIMELKKLYLFFYSKKLVIF